MKERVVMKPCFDSNTCTHTPHTLSSNPSHHKAGTSACATEARPSFVIAYPFDGSPLVVSTEDATQVAELPENAEQDYAIMKNPKTGKDMVTSPSLGYSMYAPHLKSYI